MLLNTYKVTILNTIYMRYLCIVYISSYISPYASCLMPYAPFYCPYFKVSSTETSHIFGTIVFDTSSSALSGKTYVNLNDIQLDIMVCVVVYHTVWYMCDVYEYMCTMIRQAYTMKYICSIVYFITECCVCKYVQQ